MTSFSHVIMLERTLPELHQQLSEIFGDVSKDRPPPRIFGDFPQCPLLSPLSLCLWLGAPLNRGLERALYNVRYETTNINMKQ